MVCSLPDFSVHGISQVKISEWTTISFSRGSFQPRDQTEVSCFVGGFFTNWATREDPHRHINEKDVSNYLSVHPPLHSSIHPAHQSASKNLNIMFKFTFIAFWEITSWECSEKTVEWLAYTYSSWLHGYRACYVVIIERKFDLDIKDLNSWPALLIISYTILVSSLKILQAWVYPRVILNPNS